MIDICAALLTLISLVGDDNPLDTGNTVSLLVADIFDDDDEDDLEEM